MFVFAHLSDPHLAPVPVPLPWQMVNKRFTSYLAWLVRNRHVHSPALLAALVKDMREFAPEHIVVTGDLTNLALPAEFIASRRWLEALGPARDVTVIPGNHDACVTVDWRRSWAHWAPFMSGSESAEEREAEPSSVSDFPFVRRRGGIAFIGLTSAVPMPVTGTPAAGRLGHEQIAHLRRILAELRRQGLFRIVLIHHSPLADISIRKGLLDSREFAEALGNEGAELVLHGHLHQSDFEEIKTAAGTVPVIGVPSASARPHRGRPAARYHIYRVSGGPNAWRLDIEERDGEPQQMTFRGGRKFKLDLKPGGLAAAGDLKAAAGLMTAGNTGERGTPSPYRQIEAAAAS